MEELLLLVLPEELVAMARIGISVTATILLEMLVKAVVQALPLA
jgi:hypothetical protein